MDHFISMYIDNELSLDEKILFIEHIEGNKRYTDEAVALIKQEKELVALFNKPVPEIIPPSFRGRSSARIFTWAAAACLLIFLSFAAGTRLPLTHQPSPEMTAQISPISHRRFVIYQKESNQVEISGSFTNWKRISLMPTGTEGYWEVNLTVPSGEHRYSFIVDNNKRLPDPTVSAKETDDFGTFNSIIKVEATI